jgi:ribonucleoside-diphosphate reductase alpha subunit
MWQTSERVEAHRLEAGDRLGEWEDDHGAHHSPRVRAVIQMGLFAPTFCFTEAENHAGVFAGLLTGQCAEIIEYSSPTETAVCNLASMSLPAFVTKKEGKKTFDFALFRKVTKVAIRNLNRVIDVNFYPIPEAEFSNKRHRPVGLGVQGLADVFAMMGYAWESPEAALLNKRIFAHMHYAALEASCDLAAAEGVYPTYHGSPMSKGSFQYDLWKTEPLVDDGLDWDTLGHYISRIGVRNSLLIAAMPTASTSQILGNCECIEPYATHIFTRRTLAGEFIVVNKHLVAALLERGLWSVALKDAIVANNGSVQGLKEVPADIQALFKTVWEIKQRTLVDMAAERGPYICQSQSLNLFLGDPDYKKLSSMHFYAWKQGLKTGIYYLRTRAVASAQKFTVEPVTLSNTVSATASAAVEKKAEEDPKECLMCSA